MLAKLFKLDFKWINKFLPYFTLGTALSLLITRLTANSNIMFWIVISQIFQNITISLAISTLVNVLARTVARFRRNFYKDEAYLTHTLPIEKSTLWTSKVLAMLASSTLVLAFVGAIFCVLFPTFWNIIKINLENSLGPTLLVALVGLLEGFALNLAIFDGVLLGHRSDSKRAQKSALFTVILYFIPQTLLLALVYFLSRLNSDFAFLFEESGSAVLGLSTFQVVAWTALAFYLLLCAVYFLLGKRTFKKGVDVE